MERFPLKKIVIPLIIVVLIFAFGVMNSIGAEKIKLSDTRYYFTTKHEALKVDDVEGHAIAISESKAVDIGSKVLSICRNTYDLVRGNGTIRGYCTMMEPDGRVTRFTSHEGKVMTTLSPEKKPIMTVEGTWIVVKGIAEWQGATGGGTWKMKGIAEGIFVMDWQGEMVKP